MTEWRDVAGFEGLYQVSDTGQVRSLERVVPCGSGTRRVPERTLAFGTLPHGYKIVGLHRHNQQTMCRVHSLVAEAFLGPRPAGYDVCHDDSDPSNNHVSNLRYDTRSENMKDAMRADRGRGQFVRKTHCVQGHPLSGETAKERQCVPCQRRREAESYQRRKGKNANTK